MASSACLGAIVRESDPSYLLYGTRLQRHIVYLPFGNPVGAANATGLNKVVVNSQFAYSANQFVADGWKVRPIGGAWVLATRKAAPGITCTP